MATPASSRILVATLVVVGTFGAAARASAGYGPDTVDLVGFAPPESVAAQRGREVALRFDLGARFELALQVNNAFTAQNRQAMARAEARIAAIPGVRKVVGPGGLLALGVDGAGRVWSGPLLAGGSDDDANELARQRLIRRSDAIGWFLSRDGTEIRLLIDADNLPQVRGAIEAAAASSGLVLLSGGVPATPLWPRPDREPRPFAPWLPFLLLALVMLPSTLAAALWSRPTTARALFAALAIGVAAAAPAMLAPVAPLRRAAVGAGLGAAILFLVTVFIVRAVGRRRPGTQWETVRVRAPLIILLPSIALLGVVAASWRGLFLGTQLWRETSVFFVDVRGDLEQPVVMREIRRLTDFLRAEPGVAHAWSIADLFFAVPVAGEEVAGIPSALPVIQAILARARDDSAVRLGLGADHREALIGVRLDEESGVDRLTVLQHLEDYLVQDHRPALLRVDLSDRRTAPATRALGRGILASDARERVLRICARSGRNLNPDEAGAIDRAMRRSALVPTVDPAKLKGEIAQEVSDFVEDVAVAESHVGLPRPTDRQRLANALFVQPFDASVADVLDPLRVLWGRRLSRAALDGRAGELQRRLIGLRRRHNARINFNDVLYGAELPTEGVLSEEVRHATLEAMGPIVGMPVARHSPGAFLLDAVPVGGAPSDRALSAAWLPRMGIGILLSAALTALLLAAVGGFAALRWWPVALCFGAALVVVPAIAAVPIGALTIAALSGALAGGATFAVAFAPGRRDW